MSFLMKKRVWIHQGRRFTTRSHRQTVFYHYTYCAFGIEFWDELTICENSSCLCTESRM